jgi:hypothetical protein
VPDREGNGAPGPWVRGGSGRSGDRPRRNFFEKFTIDIDNVWRARFQAMQDDIDALTAPGDDVDSLIHKADQALYAVKSQGRNRIAWHASAAQEASA